MDDSLFAGKLAELAEMGPERRDEALGNAMFLQVKELRPQLNVGAITGVLLGLPDIEVLRMLNDRKLILERIQLAFKAVSTKAIVPIPTKTPAPKPKGKAAPAPAAPAPAAAPRPEVAAAPPAPAPVAAPAPPPAAPPAAAASGFRADAAPFVLRAESKPFVPSFLRQ